MTTTIIDLSDKVLQYKGFELRHRSNGDTAIFFGDEMVWHYPREFSVSPRYGKGWVDCALSNPPAPCKETQKGYEAYLRHADKYDARLKNLGVIKNE